MRQCQTFVHCAGGAGNMNDINEKATKKWLADPTDLMKLVLQKRQENRIIHFFAEGRMRSDIRDAMVGAFQEYMKSQEWKIVKKHVKERDNNTCQNCGILLNTENGEGAVVHHLHYDHFGKANREEETSCILLCRKCHNKAHLQSEMKNITPFWATRSFDSVYLCESYISKCMQLIDREE